MSWLFDVDFRFSRIHGVRCSLFFPIDLYKVLGRIRVLRNRQMTWWVTEGNRKSRMSETCVDKWGKYGCWRCRYKTIDEVRSETWSMIHSLRPSPKTGGPTMFRYPLLYLFIVICHVTHKRSRNVYLNVVENKKGSLTKVGTSGLKSRESLTNRLDNYIERSVKLTNFMSCLFEF